VAKLVNAIVRQERELQVTVPRKFLQVQVLS